MGAIDGFMEETIRRRGRVDRIGRIDNGRDVRRCFDDRIGRLGIGLGGRRFGLALVATNHQQPHGRHDQHALHKSHRELL